MLFVWYGVIAFDKNGDAIEGRAWTAREMDREGISICFCQNGRIRKEDFLLPSEWTQILSNIVRIELDLSPDELYSQEKPWTPTFLILTEWIYTYLYKMKTSHLLSCIPKEMALTVVENCKDVSIYYHHEWTNEKTTSYSIVENYLRLFYFLRVWIIRGGSMKTLTNSQKLTKVLFLDLFLRYDS